jgi:hypothetical protein
VKRLLLLAFILLPSSCSNTPPTVTPAPATESTGPATANPEAETISVEIINSELAVGQERIAFRMYDSAGNEILGDNNEVEVNVYRNDPSTGGRSAVAGGAALYFGIPIEDGGAWVVYSEFDSSGPWSLDALVTRSDGWSGKGEAPFEVKGPTDLPRVGDRPPDLDSPTADAEGLSAITSATEPDPDLYSISLAEAVDSGKPTVVYLGSPAHCPTELCAATLDEIEVVKGLYGSQVNFIHIETRDLESPEATSAAAEPWHLPSEPWTFVLDAQGRITARIEGPIDRTELELLVKRALGVE